MEHLPEFIANHWILTSTFLALVIAFFITEAQRGGATVSPQGLSNLINTKNAVVLDIRDSGEFRQGHITNSINIPYAKLKDSFNDLKKHGEAPIVIVCKIGQTAGAAAKDLKAAGFTQVFKLDGGISRWKGDNLPLVRK